MKLEKGSQNDNVYKHLKRGWKLTPLQALQKYGTMNLAQRIADLRNKYNIPISDEWVTVGNNKRVKRYFITKTKKK